MLIREIRSEGATTRFVISPNRSLSWRGNQLFFASMATVSFGIAGVFTAMGYWIVLPFAGLEMAVLAIALYVCSWRTSHCEVVSIVDDHLEVCVGRYRPEHSWTFSRHWARVVLDRPREKRYPSRLLIRSHGRQVEIGACLNDEERRELAKALQHALAG